MKILFLDIDGVLNSGRTLAAFGGYPHDFSSQGMGKFDPVAIGLIQKLCIQTSCEIVLSSTWRIDHTCVQAANALDLPIIASTPILNNTARGFEINAWLTEHPEVQCYAIVDDIDAMLDFQKPFFVQTDASLGLTLENYRDLKRILNRSLL